VHSCAFESAFLILSFLENGRGQKILAGANPSTGRRRLRVFLEKKGFNLCLFVGTHKKVEVIPDIAQIRRSWTFFV